MKYTVYMFESGPQDNIAEGRAMGYLGKVEVNTRKRSVHTTDIVAAVRAELATNNELPPVVWATYKRDNDLYELLGTLVSKHSSMCAGLIISSHETRVAATLAMDAQIAIHN